VFSSASTADFVWWNAAGTRRGSRWSESLGWGRLAIGHAGEQNRAAHDDCALHGRESA
jgi:hypothetical protein